MTDTPLTDDELAWIDAEFGARMPNTCGRLVAEVLRLRSVLRAVANMENSPMGTAYELPRVLAEVRAALATPASPPPARQGETK